MGARQEEGETRARCVLGAAMIRGRNLLDRELVPEGLALIDWEAERTGPVRVGGSSKGSPGVEGAPPRLGGDHPG